MAEQIRQSKKDYARTERVEEVQVQTDEEAAAERARFAETAAEGEEKVAEADAMMLRISEALGDLVVQAA